jgi:hypothetical protein
MSAYPRILSVIADILALTLRATSGCELSQQICPLLDQLVGGGR